MKISLSELYDLWDDDATFAEMQAATGLCINALVHELIKAGTRPYPGALKTAAGRPHWQRLMAPASGAYIALAPHPLLQIHKLHCRQRTVLGKMQPI